MPMALICAYHLYFPSSINSIAVSPSAPKFLKDSYEIVHLDEAFECFELFEEECVSYGTFRLCLNTSAVLNLVIEIMS